MQSHIDDPSTRDGQRIEMIKNRVKIFFLGPADSGQIFPESGPDWLFETCPATRGPVQRGLCFERNNFARSVISSNANGSGLIQSAVHSLAADLSSTGMIVLDPTTKSRRPQPLTAVLHELSNIDATVGLHLRFYRPD